MAKTAIVCLRRLICLICLSCECKTDAILIRLIHQVKLWTQLKSETPSNEEDELTTILLMRPIRRFRVSMSSDQSLMRQKSSTSRAHSQSLQITSETTTTILITMITRASDLENESWCSIMGRRQTCEIVYKGVLSQVSSQVRWI